MNLDCKIFVLFQKVLKGNVNQMEIGSNLLEPAIIARYIRIFDVKHNDYMCLRLELFGCQSGESRLITLVAFVLSPWIPSKDRQPFANWLWFGQRLSLLVAGLQRKIGAYCMLIGSYPTQSEHCLCCIVHQRKRNQEQTNSILLLLLYTFICLNFLKKCGIFL